jgi:cell division protein FtsA
MRVAAGRKAHRQTQDIVGVLDVGTGKTVCVIACVPGSRAAGASAAGVEVLGIGDQPTRGLTAGMVTELDAAEQAIRAAVMQAERMAGVVLEDVCLGVACRGLRSSTFTAGSEIEEGLVGDGDIDRLLQAGRTFAERDGRTLLHMNCISYRLDEAAEIPDPRGMAGSKLAADLHAVTVKEAPLQNLLQVVERAYLTVSSLAPSPLASGLASTTEEERHLGVVAIDIGAGTTTIAMFAQGHLLWTDVVPGGGGNITTDIARTLAVPVPQAERIKRECGTLAKTASGDDEATLGAQAGSLPVCHRTAIGEVRDVVRGRLLVHLRHVAQRIKSSGVAQYAAHWVVLTGGASLQPGLRELAAEVFARPVRLAQPRPLPGMPAGFCHPAYATATGLVPLALDPAAGVRRGQPGSRPSGYLGRVGQWLMDSF